MVPCSWHFEHCLMNHMCAGGRAGWEVLCGSVSRWSLLLCACVHYDRVGCKGLFLILGGNFFVRLLYCIWWCLMPHTESGHTHTHALMPSCRVAVRLLLLVVAGTTSQRLQTDWGRSVRMVCLQKSLLSVGGIIRHVFSPLLRLHMLVELIFQHYLILTHSCVCFPSVFNVRRSVCQATLSGLLVSECMCNTMWSLKINKKC